MCNCVTEHKLCIKKISLESDLLKTIQNKLQNICEEIDQCYVFHNNEDHYQKPLCIRQDGIYLKTQKIVDKKAKLQYSIFLILIDHYFDEFINGPSYIDSSNICSKLFKQHKIDIDEQQLWAAISKIRANVNKLCNCSVIESKKWEGYRLVDNILLRRLNRI